MKHASLWARGLLGLMVFAGAARAESPEPSWEHAGWGGGGDYWSAAFHPTENGVIYLGGDVAGVYKTTDHGKHWRMVNNGLANYGVFTLAVDRQNPQTVYAGTPGGLCKSTDGAEHWRLLTKTGPKELKITAEPGKSFGNVAVDPSNGLIVYAGNWSGKIFKSVDGGENWEEVYKLASAEPESAETLRAQIGKSNGDSFGGFWLSLNTPADIKTEEYQGIGVALSAVKAPTKVALSTAMMQVQTKEGVTYRAGDLRFLFENGAGPELVLKTDEFVLDPQFVKKNPEKAKTAPSRPDWKSINRIDFCCVGNLASEAQVVRLGNIRLVPVKPDGEAVVLRDVSKDKTVHTYGNVKIGAPASGGVYCVTVSPKNSALVLAATTTSGVLRSDDSGKTWKALATPKSATSVAAAATDENVLFATFGGEGAWKSTDKGETWTKCYDGSKNSARKVAISPVSAEVVYLLSGQGWTGVLNSSQDGGKTWKECRRVAADREWNPSTGEMGGLSRVNDLTINPADHKEVFLAANWRPCITTDGGEALVEAVRGADITCVHDIRFKGNRTYVSAMDEGAFVSENNGKNWKQLSPLKHSRELSGHYWRLAISENNGTDRIITTCSPWEKLPNRVLISEDGGVSFKQTLAGLPGNRPTANTMWGEGFARALAMDPKDPKVVYMGIDGDPVNGKGGGGIFKSEDGGYNWKPLAAQPGSRRMFYGLAVDPTDSKRLFWGACATGGGVYRSEDGGESWQHVFKNETFVFNLHVTADGTIFAAGKELWRSTDHGKSWKQVSTFKTGRTLVGLEVDPRDAKTIWVSAVTWSGNADGGVYKTSDGGATWQEITGDLPYRKPLILRFNPATNELWAGGVGLSKIKQ